MRIFNWLWIILGTFGFVLIFLLVGYFQPEVIGDWCGQNENWAKCYRGWLGALAGYVALFFGALTIMAIRTQTEASEKISFRAIADARAAKIAGFVAALKVSLLVADSLNKNGRTTGELFVQLPELLAAEQEDEFQQIREDVKAFNNEIDKYITLRINATSARVGSESYGARGNAYERALAGC